MWLDTFLLLQKTIFNVLNLHIYIILFIIYIIILCNRIYSTSISYLDNDYINLLYRNNNNLIINI